MRLSPAVKKNILDQSCVSAAIRILADEFGNVDAVMTTIQVGACNGNIGNDHVQDIIKSRDFVRAYLVEAVDWLYEDLVRVMNPYKDRINCYNLAISGQDGPRNFYSGAKRLGKDQPYTEAWKLYQIGSLLKEHISLHLPEEYVECREVHCLSPESFMREIKLDPQQLDLLVVDAEGMDAEIVIGFLEISLPKMIVYEHKILYKSSYDRVLSELGARRYQHKKFGDDILAIR